MKSVLDIPLTVKMRVGIMDNKNIAHLIAPKLRDWGVSMATVSTLCNLIGILVNFDGNEKHMHFFYSISC